MSSTTAPSTVRRSVRRTAVRTTSYREASVSDTDGVLPTAAPQTRVPPKRKRGAPAVAGDDDDEYGLSALRGDVPANESEESSALSTAESDEPAPQRKRRSPKKKARTEKKSSEVPEEDVDVESSTKKKRKTPRKARVAGEGDTVSPVKKARKPRAPKSEPVYVIPDVERKETTFRGRLGYACLNTILRNRKPADQAVFCSRTCRIDSIKKNGIEWMKELGRQNVKDLIKLVEWNEANNIRFMRMSSEMFPFASHPTYGYTLEYCADELRAVGELANKLGHRLTMHPGQFTQLGSPRKEVVENAVRELAYHAEMMDRMGLGKDSVMIIHGGGVYGDKQGSLDRIRESFKALPKNIQDRLVLENDEMCYSAEDLLPLCEELAIPLVFDYHHDWILPSSIPPAEIIRRANAIFARRGIRPKQHLSEPRPGAVTVMERRAHADRCQALPPDLPDDMDLMIEAKDKEQAVLHLYRIYGLHPVIHENLRPPAEVQTMETKGRKAHKPPGGTGRKKAAQTGVVEDDVEAKGEDPTVLAEGGGIADEAEEGVVGDAEAAPAEETKQETPARRSTRTRKTREVTTKVHGEEENSRRESSTKRMRVSRRGTREVDK